jgi:hypothetical protein
VDQSGGVLGCDTETAHAGNVALAVVSVLPMNGMGGWVVGWYFVTNAAGECGCVDARQFFCQTIVMMKGWKT